ncbi:hypothetical protein CSOJ01_00550 [Colletotrichum sojae]|uniref:Uncharacterized protein n=1 Tax=Colletotrichum sojae TaxID=2175907 RepID=A0A8H6JXW6_9PEZI|nr:hypothetical protein CSOJ01_00550 [Colletotrichum sojae]
MLLKRLAQKRLPIQQTGHQVTALHPGRGVSLITKAGHWDDLASPQSRAAAFPVLSIAVACTAGPSTGRTKVLTYSFERSGGWASRRRARRLAIIVHWGRFQRFNRLMPAPL